MGWLVGWLTGWLVDSLEGLGVVTIKFKTLVVMSGRLSLHLPELGICRDFSDDPIPKYSHLGDCVAELVFPFQRWHTSRNNAGTRVSYLWRGMPRCYQIIIKHIIYGLAGIRHIQSLYRFIFYVSHCQNTPIQNSETLQMGDSVKFFYSSVSSEY